MSFSILGGVLPYLGFSYWANLSTYDPNTHDSWKDSSRVYSMEISECWL